MPTRSKKRLIGYKPRPDAQKRVESAKTAIRAILSVADKLTGEHLRKFLDLGLWQLSKTAATKYRIRFRTAAAIAAGPKANLQHDHVYQRKKLREALVKNPQKLDEIAQKVIACVVTEKEHRLLSKISREHPELDGWERYERAGLRDTVRDLLSEEYVAAISKLSPEEQERVQVELEHAIKKTV